MEKKSNHGLTGPTSEKLKEFGLSFSLGMTILFLVSLWRGFALPLKLIVAGLGLFHITAALLMPALLRPTFAWVTGIAKIVGNVITIIVFASVFYILFTPIAWILRLAKKDLIGQNAFTPHWVDVSERDNDPKRIERMY